MSFKGLTINTPPEMEAHIGAQDDRTIWESVFGMDAVLDVGNKLNAVLISNNQLRIYDGVLVAGGAIGRIPYGEYEDVAIENGTQGQLRNDLIVAELEANTSVENMKITYVKGEAGEMAEDPVYAAGNTYEGETVRQYPIYRVRLNGLNVEGVDSLFEVLPNISTIKDDLSKTNTSLTELNSKLPLSKTVSGTTTGTGNFNLSVDPAQYDVLSVSKAGGIVFMPYIDTSGTSWAAHVCNSGHFEPIINTTISGVKVVYASKL